MNKLKKLTGILLALVMCVVMLPTAAFAAETDTDSDTTNSSKTLTVDASATEVEGKTYTTIQAAINYICDTYYADKVDYTYTDGKPETVGDDWYLEAQYGTTWKYREYPSEMSGWTIVVESGTYSHFSIYEGLDGITIKAADNATVTVNTWTGATNDEITSTYAQRAANAADTTLTQIEKSIQGIVAEESSENDGTDADALTEMPTVTIDGVEYIGVLEIPALELSLPVASEWNYENLRVSPCRYQGSAYSDDLIIAGHNYQRHFGNLKNLSIGDTVTFTDVAGNIFTYEVAEVTTLGAYSVDEMISGDWDLTLFTCTIGGRTRVTVRCAAVEDN